MKIVMIESWICRKYILEWHSNLTNLYINYYGMEYIDLNNTQRFTILNNLTNNHNNNYFRD